MKGASFRQAVPRRSDRRELRRGLRAVERAVRAEQRQALWGLFTRLATRRVPLTRVGALPSRASGQTLEFADGTNLELAVLDSTLMLGCLKEWAARRLVYLGSVDACHWPGWYSLHFRTFTHEELAVVGRVGHFAPAGPGNPRPGTPRPGGRWRQMP